MTRRLSGKLRRGCLMNLKKRRRRQPEIKQRGEKKEHLEGTSERPSG